MAGRVRRGDCGVLWRWGQQWRHFIQVSGKAVHSITDWRAQNTMRMPSERYRSKMNCRNVLRRPHTRPPRSRCLRSCCRYKRSYDPRIGTADRPLAVRMVYVMPCNTMKRALSWARRRVPPHLLDELWQQLRPESVVGQRLLLERQAQALDIVQQPTAKVDCGAG